MQTEESTTLAPPGPGTIRVRGLSKAFGSNQALAPLDLDIPSGGIVGLIGPNGSGKSTLMRNLIGLIRPDSGSIWIDGRELKGDGRNVRERLTYAPGEMGVYREMRGCDHLNWFLRGRDKEALERARELATGFGLPLERRMGSYSHGMKRQLVFAAAMAPQVPIRILDEITEGLDPSRRTDVTETLRRDAETGTTILLSSHHFGEVDRVCDRILFMRQGQVIADTKAAVIHDRAARLLRITWESEGPAQSFLDRVASGSYDQARVNGNELVLELAQADPRATLALLQESTDLPAPLQVQFGASTLKAIYRDLYGVEGT
ncbi:MAG: ABC transporter ATP-binding protein [Planctomycetes bacterium]|nr:ABC transporter ATP-binding protein [Planctomycetota bacterium]